MWPALFDAALFFDGLVGGGDAVEALAGLLLVVLAHVAHLGVELDGQRRKAFLISLSVASNSPFKTTKRLQTQGPQSGVAY